MILAAYLFIALIYWHVCSKQMPEAMEDLEKKHIELQLMDENEKNAIVAISLVVTSLCWPVVILFAIYERYFDQ